MASVPPLSFPWSAAAPLAASLVLGMAVSAAQAQTAPQPMRTAAPPSALQDQAAPSPPPGASAQRSGMAEVLVLTGTALYRERIAMPARAVLTVQLQNISRANAPAQVVAQTRQAFGNLQVPLAYRLEVPRAALDPRMRYALRATVRVDGELHFSTTQVHPVQVQSTNASGMHPPLHLLMQAIPVQAANQGPDFRSQTGANAGSAGSAGSVSKGSAAAGYTGGAAHTAMAQLQDTYWKLVALDGQPAPMLPVQEREVRITLGSANHQVQGFSGCNGMGGSYMLDGAALKFDQLVSTRKLCAPAANALEREVLAALKATSHFRVQGEQLLLLGNGRVLARFEAVYLR